MNNIEIPEATQAYDNLCIAIKALKQELCKPTELTYYHETVGITETRNIFDCYRAISAADDEEIRNALMWLAGIEEHYCGTFGKDKCLVWSEEARAIEEDSNSIYAQRVYEEGLCHYDDVDRVQEIAFDLFLEDKGVLVE